MLLYRLGYNPEEALAIMEEAVSEGRLSIDLEDIDKIILVAGSITIDEELAIHAEGIDYAEAHKRIKEHVRQLKNLDNIVGYVEYPNGGYTFKIMAETYYTMGMDKESAEAEAKAEALRSK